MALRRVRLAVAWMTLTLSLVIPSTLLAQDYDMTFTLPTAGKSGCMVCHGDANLVRIDPRDGSLLDYFVDESVLRASAHGPSKKYPNGVNCSACHTDFAYKAPHKNGDWRRNAKLACKNCKEHQDEFDVYGQGVHSIAPKPGATKAELAKDERKPLCGDCHSHAHAIGVLTPKAAEALGREYDPKPRRELHARGERMCVGECHEHQEYWDNYLDYYHGAAYRRGASDAPACWQCHGAHDSLPSSDTRSYTNENQIVDTCGAQAIPEAPVCHSRLAIGGTEPFVSDYKEFIHRRSDQYEENWLYMHLKKTREGIAEAFSLLGLALRSLFS